MTAYRPPRYEGLGAHVSGVSAWVLASILERGKALDSINNLPAIARAEVLETYDTLRAAAIYWNERHTERQGRAADRGHEPREEAPAPAADDLSAAEAAAVLGCTERRVRQLLAAERITGRRVAGRWLVNASSVDDYVLAREAA